MDGKTLLYRLRNLLDEDSTGTWLDDRTSYDFLWEAAKMFSSRTAALTGSQQFVTVADQENYVLNADFLRLLLMDTSNEYYLKFSNENGDSFVKFRDYEDIRYGNYVRTADIKVTSITTTATTLQDTGQDFSDWETTPVSTADEALYKVTVVNTVGGSSWAYLGAASTTTNADDTIAVYTDKSLSATGWNGDGTPSGTASYYKVENVSSQRVPSYFTIRDRQSLYTQITGTATSDGDASGGQCLLTDTSATFITSEFANPGDTVHNTTDGSDGIVLSIASDTTVYAALFGGTDNEWDSSDAYVIQPQGRVEIVFDPPPSKSGDIVTIEYVTRPNPVYSDYGVYRFRQNATEAIVKYAAWLYKYRDAEPNFGDKFYLYFDNAVRQEHSNLRPFIKRRKLNISFKKR